MSKSAAGSVENPGKHVKAKSGLNKSILDQGWFDGSSSAANWNTSWRGTAAGWWRYRHATPAEPAHPAVIYPKTIARRKRSSNTWLVGSRVMPMWSVLSMF